MFSYTKTYIKSRSSVHLWCVHTFANWRFLQDSEMAVRRVLLRVGQYVVANITSVHVSIDIEIYHEVLAEVTESQKRSNALNQCSTNVRTAVVYFASLAKFTIGRRMQTNTRTNCFI